MPEIKPFDGAAVLQAAPESPPERRRGRPRVTPAMWDVSVERLEGPNKSRRTIIKRFDTGAALRALDTEDQDFGYIIGPDNTTPLRLSANFSCMVGLKYSEGLYFKGFQEASGCNCQRLAAWRTP